MHIEGFLKAICRARTNDDVTLCFMVNNASCLLTALICFITNEVGPLFVFAIRRTASLLNARLVELGGWSTTS